VLRTTPAKLRTLKDAIPPARKLTKTDLAKYLNAWEQKPHIVSLGSQKNFVKFMEKFSDEDSQPSMFTPDVAAYKHMIAKAIIFKATQKFIRPMFPAFQANVTTYVISVLANRLGERVDLDRIWLKQSISPHLQEQIQVWAREVNDVLHRSASGKMISEWAKKPECWNAVVRHSYSAPLDGIPEIR
jgi:hypothetical protein